MKTRAFTLIEIVVVCSIFGLSIGIVFLIFAMGTRGFNQAVERTGAIGEIHAITRAVERDVRLTHFYSARVKSRNVTTEHGNTSRDGLSIAGLSNWSVPANFNAQGLPLWDRWVLFYASTEELGRLFRLEMRRTPRGYPLKPQNGIDPLLTNDPVNNEDALRVGVLSERVESFQAELFPAQRLVKLKLRLVNNKGLLVGSQRKVDDVLETQFELSPLNSYPDL
jgi:type II secretory pathway pseudopilin PulG